MWKLYNPNPITARVGDCTVRSISKATGQPWEKTYLDLAIYGLIKCDMPSANSVWGSYLKDKGFVRNIITETDYTVEDFEREHPEGTYILALNGHVVTIVDGDHYDTWDSGGEVPAYYWGKPR